MYDIIKSQENALFNNDNRDKISVFILKKTFPKQKHCDVCWTELTEETFNGKYSIYLHTKDN